MNKRLTGDQIMKGIARQKYGWADKKLKEILPPEIYRGAHFGDKQALGWLKERGIRIEQDGDVVTLMRGTTVVARTRLVLELANWEEMDSVVKAVGKIVPPSKV